MAADTRIHWTRIAPGDYETADGTVMMYQIPDVYPPAWNVEIVATGECIVDGAASMRDARAIYEQEVSNA